MTRDTVVDILKHLDPVGDGPVVQQSRLRHTWIATLMCEPISVWTLMQAAGLRGARIFTEIAVYLTPAVTPIDVRGER